MDKQNRKTLRDALRDRLKAVADQAVKAQRMSVTSDNLCDVIDEIDNDLQEAIEIVNQLRADGEAS